MAGIYTQLRQVVKELGIPVNSERRIIAKFTLRC